MCALILFIFAAWMGIEKVAGAYSAHIKLESQRAICIQVVIWRVFDLLLYVFLYMAVSGDLIGYFLEDLSLQGCNK